MPKAELAREQKAADDALAQAQRQLAELQAAEQRRAQAEANAPRLRRRSRVPARSPSNGGRSQRRLRRKQQLPPLPRQQQPKPGLFVACGQQPAHLPPARQTRVPPSPPPAPTTVSPNPPTAEDTSSYGDSAAWAASAYSQAIRMCESGDNYSINTGNGYYGALAIRLPFVARQRRRSLRRVPEPGDQGPARLRRLDLLAPRGWVPWGVHKSMNTSHVKHRRRRHGVTAAFAALGVTAAVALAGCGGSFQRHLRQPTGPGSLDGGRLFGRAQHPAGQAVLPGNPRLGLLRHRRRRPCELIPATGTAGVINTLAERNPCAAADMYRAQNTDIGQQLAAGIRYLDLRVSVPKGWRGADRDVSLGNRERFGARHPRRRRPRRRRNPHRAPPGQTNFVLEHQFVSTR